MNYNVLYRRKDRIRRKRSAEEKRNAAKILLAGLFGVILGLTVMGAAIWLFHQ